MLIEEAQDFATSVLLQCLLVVQNAIGGGQYDVADLSGGQHVAHHPVHLLFIAVKDGTKGYLDLDVESGRVHTTLVQTSEQVQHDLLASSVINYLELAHILYRFCCLDVTITLLLHETEELDDNAIDRSEEHLALTSTFSVHDCLQAV